MYFAMVELATSRVITAFGQWVNAIRIVYKIHLDQILVVVVGVGRRKDGDKKDIDPGFRSGKDLRFTTRVLRPSAASPCWATLGMIVWVFNN